VNLTISLDGPASVHDRARRFADGTGTHEHVRRNMELIRTAYPDYSRERVMFAAVLSDPIDWGVLNQYFCEELQLPSGKLITADVRDGSQETAARTGDGRNFGIVYGAWRQALAGGCLFGTWPGGSRKAKLKALGQTCLSFRAITVPLVRLHERHICKQGWPDGVFQPGGCCLMPTRRLLVAHDGTLFPCDRSDQNAGTTVGNIRDGIDTERVFVLLRDFFDATRAECADCWAIRLCTQCAGTVVDRSGISRDAKLSRCDEIRRSAEDLLTQYCSILEQYPHAFKHNGEVSIERPALRKLT
jgi:uncharacterized protein